MSGGNENIKLLALRAYFRLLMVNNSFINVIKIIINIIKCQSIYLRDIYHMLIASLRETEKKKLRKRKQKLRMP